MIQNHCVHIPAWQLIIALAIYLPLLLVITTVGVPAGETLSSVAEQDPEEIVAVAAREFLGPIGYWLVILAAVLSMFTALQANLYAASRIARAMASLCRSPPDRACPRSPTWVS